MYNDVYDLSLEELLAKLTEAVGELESQEDCGSNNAVFLCRALLEKAPSESMPVVLATLDALLERCNQWDEASGQISLCGEEIDKVQYQLRGVSFRPKYVFQPPDCINQSAEYQCHNKSVIEACKGSAHIRCCGDRRCRKRAAELALLTAR